MAQQVVFAWGREFETNIKQVDSEHRYLVEIINSLGNKLAIQNTVLSDMIPLFEELVNYTKYHFSNEEGLMLEA
ncbi:hemerythrin domain-containing protein, partial [uncultured Campylobacter sp.]|uniref:hemerythrin domain-containing protein n=1 Tax=uncultured Campylobacter sp. TaxID=218934 RepID=UPI0026359081